MLNANYLDETFSKMSYIIPCHRKWSNNFLKKNLRLTVVVSLSGNLSHSAGCPLA